MAVFLPGKAEIIIHDLVKQSFFTVSLPAGLSLYGTAPDRLLLES